MLMTCCLQNGLSIQYDSRDDLFSLFILFFLIISDYSLLVIFCATKKSRGVTYSIFIKYFFCPSNIV